MLRLVKLEEQYQAQLIDMLEEWNASGEKIVPYAIRRTDYRMFHTYLNRLEHKDITDKHVPDSTFFCWIPTETSLLAR